MKKHFNIVLAFNLTARVGTPAFLCSIFRSSIKKMGFQVAIAAQWPGDHQRASIDPG
jgi:hypothetical protein